MYLVHVRAEIQAHIQLTNYQYNLPPFEKKIERKSNREGIAERFRDACVRKNVETDLCCMDHFEEVIKGWKTISYAMPRAMIVEPIIACARCPASAGYWR